MAFLVVLLLVSVKVFSQGVISPRSVESYQTGMLPHRKKLIVKTINYFLDKKVKTVSYNTKEKLKQLFLVISNQTAQKLTIRYSLADVYNRIGFDGVLILHPKQVLVFRDLLALPNSGYDIHFLAGKQILDNAYLVSQQEKPATYTKPKKTVMVLTSDFDRNGRIVYYYVEQEVDDVPPRKKKKKSTPTN
ncbi:MAG: hypothetical protein NZL83_02295 [Candidatus Absconditabacterales bacterium]|nr:hypothetical protein [Candidatus Absconditabacterales bacterium]